MRSQKIAISLLASVLLILAACRSGASNQPIKVGLIAPFTGGSAASGEAIHRGMILAADEINRSGGVLGRPIEIVTRDVANDPQAGVDALAELVDRENIVAIFGGIFSPVMMAQLDLVHTKQLPLIDPWGSASGITQNGRAPNYAFRVSVSDVYADEFLARYALDVVGIHKPAIIADNTSWGEANLAGLRQWFQQRGVAPVTAERFDQGDKNMSRQVRAMRDAGADSVLMVANAPEGAAIVKAMGALGWHVPVISHWGISGGQFVEDAGVDNAEGVYTLQTFTFLGNLSPQAEALKNAYFARFNAQTVDQIRASEGVVHGYDGLQLLARAIQKAGTTEGSRVREALEQPVIYDGIVKRYNAPFSADRHDALVAVDYMMTVWKTGQLVPAPTPRLRP